MADLTIPITIVPVAGAKVADGQLSFEAFTAGTPIYRRTDGRWAKSRANSVNTYQCHGFSISTAEAANQRFSVLTEGDATVSGLTQGTDLYVSVATAGKLAPRADVTTGGAGSYITYVGVATSATNISIQPHNSGAQVP